MPFVFSACGTASVEYTLSEDGSCYIVSGVKGNKSALKKLEIPSTYGEDDLPVREIGYEAFKGCSSLLSVTLGENIQVIGERAFMKCAFSEITIPESVTTIERAAFGMCNYLKEIEIPYSVTNLGVQTFAYCTALEKAVVKANISDLPADTFKNSVVSSGSDVFTSTSLTEVYIASTITKINATALSGNYISDIYFAGSQEEWNDLYFYINETDENGGLKEKRYEKSEVLAANTAVHFDCEL